mmetsp:Transcript_16328/g.51893  ORF Transcript_16328/g.51893 Transcript_16328/m.51893 type:complete len:211 (+) Transcript_16328:119-751(+)
MALSFTSWVRLEGKPMLDLRKLVVFHALLDWLYLLIWLIYFIFKTVSTMENLCSPLYTNAECRAFVADYLGTPLLSFFVPLVVLSASYYMLIMICNSYVRHRGADVEGETKKEHRLASYVVIFVFIHMWVNVLWFIMLCCYFMWFMLVLVIFGIAQDIYVLTRALDIRYMLRLRNDVGLVAYTERCRDVRERRLTVYWAASCVSTQSRHR